MQVFKSVKNRNEIIRNTPEILLRTVAGTTASSIIY